MLVSIFPGDLEQLAAELLGTRLGVGRRVDLLLLLVEKLVEPASEQEQVVEELGLARTKAFLLPEIVAHIVAEFHVPVDPLPHVADERDGGGQMLFDHGPLLQLRAFLVDGIDDVAAVAGGDAPSSASALRDRE